MGNKETRFSFVNKTTLWIVGIFAVIFFAVVLLWHGNANSMQATPAMVAGVYFDGEYRIADGQWQKIEKGKHISSTEGDVTLRGNFHMLTPDGEYIGIYSDSVPIALYTNHINLTFYEGRNEPYIHQLFRDLRQTLEALGMEEIFERNNYLYSVNPEKIDCDYYSYLKTGKPEFIGEYMSQYSWAEETCGLLWKKRS